MKLWECMIPICLYQNYLRLRSAQSARFCIGQHNLKSIELFENGQKERNVYRMWMKGSIIDSTVDNEHDYDLKPKTSKSGGKKYLHFHLHYDPASIFKIKCGCLLYPRSFE